MITWVEKREKEEELGLDWIGWWPTRSDEANILPYSSMKEILGFFRRVASTLFDPRRRSDGNRVDRINYELWIYRIQSPTDNLTIEQWGFSVRVGQRTGAIKWTKWSSSPAVHSHSSATSSASTDPAASANEVDTPSVKRWNEKKGWRRRWRGSHRRKP